MRKPKTAAKPAPSAGATLELARHLDYPAAAPLHESLMAARGAPIVLDASSVERIGGQCLQVLLSAVVTWKSDMTALEIAKPSQGFQDGLQLLGLTVDSLIDKEITR